MPPKRRRTKTRTTTKTSISMRKTSTRTKPTIQTPDTMPEVPLALSLRELVEVLIHDVKNPLASLLTNAQFIRDTTPAGDVRDAADDIIVASHWIDRLLSNTGDLGRLSEDTDALVSGESDLSQVLAEATQTMTA